MSIESLAGVDIYVLDQIQRGRFTKDMRVLDAGCGKGRNLRWFLTEGADVFGVDTSPEAVAGARELAAELSPSLPADRFQVAGVTDLPLDSSSVDAVICCAVLHFAEGHDEFDAMMDSLWRVLAPGGIFFARLASTIGIETAVTPDAKGWATLPDGTDRYLVDEARLMDTAERLGGELLDPLKSTIVQGKRSMTTWVMRKGGAA